MLLTLSSATIKLRNLDGSVVVVKASKDRWRYLGFFFDPSLSFSSHIDYYVNKSLSSISALRMIGNAVRGITVPRRVQVFKACIWPILSYGLPLWYQLNGKGVKAKLSRLERAQRQGLLWMSGGFRTTPTASLEFLLGIPPVRVYCDLLVNRLATRLAALSDSHPLSIAPSSRWLFGL